MDYARKMQLYIDTKTKQIYTASDDGAALLGASIPNIQYGELVNVLVQLTDGAPTFDDDGELENAYTGYAGSLATCEMVVDNNYNWFDPARLEDALDGSAISSIRLTGINSVPRKYGTIRLSSSDIVHYCDWTASENIYTFTLADQSFDPAAFTPSTAYTAGTAVRLIEQPIIVSALNEATPATGLFSGVLDAANPIYEALVEGTSGISGTMWEFSIYVSGRVVFRIRTLFDCLGAIDPGEGSDWIRPSVWTQADSRYLRDENIAASATELEPGSDPTVTISQTGSGASRRLTFNFGIPAATLNNTFSDFSSVSSANLVTFSGYNMVPVGVRTNKGNYYPVEKTSVSIIGSTTTIDVTPYLAYDDSPAFSGTWRAYFAAGMGGEVSGIVPPGTVLAFAGDAANIPNGYLLCNGARLLMEDYPALYAAIGLIYSGEHYEGYFNLPDFRGRFLRGYKNNVSEALGTLQEDAIRNITGSQTNMLSAYQSESTDYNNGNDSAIYAASVAANTNFSANDSPRQAVRLYMDASRCVPTASENRPVNYAVNYIIKY